MAAEEDLVEVFEEDFFVEVAFFVEVVSFDVVVVFLRDEVDVV